MALEGSIRDFGLTEIFQLILLQKKEGVLTLTEGKRQVSVRFREGEIIEAESKEAPADEALGNAFLNAGKITVEQLKDGLRRRDRKTLGQALVALGYLSSDQVRTQSRILTEETVFRLFEWKMGNYKFEQKNISFDPEWVAPLRTEFILMEGMRRLDEWPALLKKIPSREIVFEIAAADDPAGPAPDNPPAERGKEETFEPTENWAGPEEKKEGPNQEDASFLTWIDGKRTVQGIIDQAQMGAFPVYKEISDLLSAGKIKIKERAAQGRAAFLSVKKLTAIEASYRTLFLGAIVGAAALVWILSYRSIKSTLTSAFDTTQEFGKLQVWNERDILFQALDLYHLKYQRYPDDLHRLVEEGFLVSPKERSIDLSKWNYEVDVDNAKHYSLNVKRR